MARGKAEKQPFQMHPSLRQHLFSVQRYSSNTGQVQNMSMLLEVTVYNGWVMWRKELIKKKGSCPLFPMKKDQTNWTKVYKWYPLAWELGPSGSDISLGLVQQWMYCSIVV